MVRFVKTSLVTLCISSPIFSLLTPLLSFISSDLSALLFAFYFSYCPYFVSFPSNLPVPFPNHLALSHLIPSHLLCSPLFASPLNAEHLISPQVNKQSFTTDLMREKRCAEKKISATSMARDQKHQNFTLIIVCFAFAYIHLPSILYIIVRSKYFNLHLISSNLYFSHLLSSIFIFSKPTLPILMSSNLSFLASYLLPPL